ncbi:hypothetical protein V8G54_027684 [Vigna mungo]|uniref:Transmembrane protein n=1 Tax=Vigna mungo TaxID=3915 RepID=A0AAQ3N2Y9_VIGMU
MISRSSSNHLITIILLLSSYHIQKKFHFQQLLFQAPFQNIQSRQHLLPLLHTTTTISCFTSTNINKLLHFSHNTFPSKFRLFGPRIIVWKHRIKLQPVLVEVPPTYPSLLHLHGGVFIIVVVVIIVASPICMFVNLALLVPFLHTGQP